ncbi:hypothetical protein E2320_016314 [Naja naja]|nr:hypothetical protein E2320_016314 [Naja naja]
MTSTPPHTHTYLISLQQGFGKALGWKLGCCIEVQEGNASPAAKPGEGEEKSGKEAEEGRRGSRRNRKQEEAEAGIAKGAGGGRTWNSVVASQLQAQLRENFYCLRAGTN